MLLRLTVVPPVPAGIGLSYWSPICTVMVPETTPAVSVWATVVINNALRPAARTVSGCVAAVSPLAAAVIVGEPATVSLYVKLAELAAAEMVMLVTCVAPLKNTPPVDVVVRPTVSPPEPAAAVLPKASSNCTVMVAEATPAMSACGTVMKTSLLAAAGLTVSCCVAERLPLVAAVSVGVPAACPGR